MEKKQVVLMIDDKKTDIELTKMAIEYYSRNANASLELLAVSTEAELSSVLVRKNKPNIVVALVDVRFGTRHKGPEFVRMLKQNPLTANIPVWAFSKTKSQPDIDSMLSAGATGYSIKAADAARFMQVIETILKDPDTTKS